MNLGGVIHLNKTGIFLICITLCILFIYMVTSNHTTENTHSSTATKINLKQLLQLALEAAENGGNEVVKVKDHLTVTSKGLTKEGADDSVTTADFLSHCSMIKTLKQKYPSLNIISEEAKTSCDDKSSPIVNFNKINNSTLSNLPDEWIDENDVTIWIDPLDATHEYTEKLYEYVTTMVCAAVKGTPVLGIIHKPFSKNTAWAWVGKAVSPQLLVKEDENANKNKVKITISRSHSGEIKNILNKKLKDYDLIIAAGAGYKALQVATRNVDAYMHITAIKKWDICAGNAIINAVGGKMTTKFNKAIDYKDSDNVVNEDGLVVTLNNHQKFLDLL